MENTLPMTYDQKDSLAQLACMSTDKEHKPEPRPEVYICDTGYVDYSRDILASNIAGRFGGR